MFTYRCPQFHSFTVLISLDIQKSKTYKSIKDEASYNETANMIQGAKIAALLVVTLAVAARGDDPGCFQAGECQRSLILNETYVPDVLDCMSFCEETEGCQDFTFYEYYFSNNCRVFQECIEFSAEICTSCISGVRGCEPLVCNQQGNNLISDVSIKHVTKIV